MASEHQQRSCQHEERPPRRPEPRRLRYRLRRRSRVPLDCAVLVGDDSFDRMPDLESSVRIGVLPAEHILDNGARQQERDEPSHRQEHGPGAVDQRCGWSASRTDRRASNAQPNANASRTTPVSTFSPPGMNGRATRTTARTGRRPSSQLQSTRRVPEPFAPGARVDCRCAGLSLGRGTLLT